MSKTTTTTTTTTTTDGGPAQQPGGPGGPGPGGWPNPLNVQKIAQTTRMWCWAASGQMILQYLGNSSVTQCQQAARYYNNPSCCDTTPPSACVDPGGWPFASSPSTDGHWLTYPQFGISPTTRLTPYGIALTWDQLTQEIDQGRPVAFVIAFNGGGGHVRVAVGYQVLQNVRYVIIIDPLPQPDPTSSDPLRRAGGWQGPITYDDYVAGVYFGLPYTHWLDIYEITMTQTVTGPGGPPGGPPGVPGPGGLQQSQEVATAFLPSALVLTGVQSPGGPQSNYLGDALPLVSVQLDQLRQPGPGGLGGVLQLAQAQTVLYPIMQRDNLVASIETVQKQQNWDAKVGNVTLTESLRKVRDRHAAITGLPPSAYSVVAMPALGLFFLAFLQGGETMLIPTATDASLGLVQGTAQTVERVFQIIGPLAQRHTGQPS